MTDFLSAEQSRQLLDAISNPIPPVQRTSAYNQRLIGATIVMLAMVGAYILLLIGLLVVLLFCLFLGGRLLFSPLAIFFSIIPAFVTACVLVALLKPLFAKSEKDFPAFELTQANEPFLFEFISRLCRSVGAPPPTSIAVDSEVNASASYLGGISDHRLRLTLGLPLVIGLNSRQLAGIIAHEFGHFRQAGGMKTTYLIRMINQFFSAAAFERDAWDAKLTSWSETAGRQLAGIVWIARAAVFIARLLLMGLVLAGHFFCARLLREMEFEADRVETRLAGSKNFATTCRALRLLELCQAAALDELDRYRRESRLPDNWPALIASNVAHVKSEKFRELETKLLEVKTEWHDSHPSDRDRIENAAMEKTAGTFTIELPASKLFTDISGLSRVVTLKLYQHAFDTSFKPESIKNTSQIIAVKQVEIAQGEAALRFVLEQFCGYHTFHLPRFVLGEAIDSTQYRINTEVRRDRLLRDVRGYALIRKQEEQLMDDLVKVACTRRLIEAGFNTSQATDLFPARNLHEAHFRAQQLAQEEQRIKGQLRGFRQLLGYRLIDALEFLRAEKVLAKTGAGPSVVKEVARILKAIEAVVKQSPTYEQLHFENRVILLQLAVGESQMDERLAKSISATALRIHHLFTVVHSTASQFEYPFAHGKGQVSLAYFLLSELPRRDDVAAICGAAVDLENNLDLFLKRSVARLGSLAEKVESAFGFAPLETPAEVRRD